MIFFPSSDNVEAILCAANHIQLVPVIEACVNFLKSHLSLVYCVDLLNIADLFSLHDLADDVYKYICRNLVTIGMSAEFLKLNQSQLETLLDLDYPVSCGEADVLSFVIGWIVHHHGYHWNEADKVLNKIKGHCIDGNDLMKIPNFSDFEKLIGENIHFKAFAESFKSSATEISKTAGLINLRGYHQCVVTCGGFRPGQGMTNGLVWYDQHSDSMCKLTSVPHVEQCNFGVSVVNNKLYVVGGCYNDDQMEEIAHGFGFCYNPMTNMWENITPMTMERCRFYLGSVGSKLYAIGGDPSASTDTGDFAHCEAYDIDQKMWQEIAPLPGNRMEHAGTTLDNHLYISGGLQDSEGPVFNTFFKYDPSTNIWLQLPPMITPRADHTMFTYNGAIYVIGGWYEHTQTHQRVMADTVDRFDPDLGSWSVVAAVPAPRLFASYTVKGDNVVVVGGWLQGDCQRKCDHLDILHLPSLTWAPREGSSPGSYQGSLQGSAGSPQGFLQGSTKGLEVWEHTACCLWIPSSSLEK